MKALVKRYAEPGLWMEEVPMPKVGVNDVLIKVTKAAICGTDLHMYKWDEWSQSHCTPPYIMGHEFVGVAVEVGPGVTHVQVGDRVTAEGHIVCGTCRNCRRGMGHVCENSLSVGIFGKDGAFAEYVTIPESNIVHIRPEIPDDFACEYKEASSSARIVVSSEMSSSHSNALFPSFARFSFTMSHTCIA